MIMGKNNKPVLRFRDYTDAWEQRKLGEICEQLKDTIDPQLTPDTKYFEYSMPAFDDDSEPDIVSGYEMNSIRKVINAPCLLINKLNVRKRRIWLVESPENNAVCSAEFVPVTSEISSLCFLKYIVMKDDFTAYLEDCSSGSSNSQKRVTPDVIMKATILIPTIAEQIQIGKFFSNLDSLITLHQRKYEKLQNIKKSMLDKMFPKNGNLYPEVRLSGFTDAWEQRKLGEISESFEYGLNAAATEYDGKHKYLRITDIDDSTHLFLQDNLTSPDIEFSTADDYLLQEGDVLFARTGASVGKTYIYRRSDGDLYFAGFLIRAKIKSDYDADFVFQNTLTDSYDSYIRITSQRSGQPGVNAQEYANLALSVPSLAEQKKIGAYFSHLDSLITLHQRKLETLQKMKKSLLQKMFV